MSSSSINGNSLSVEKLWVNGVEVRGGGPTVSQLTAGNGIILDPPSGQGIVQINATPVLAGVSSITPSGSGLTVNQDIGDVIITNTGVLAITAGSGITRTGDKSNYTLANSGVLDVTAGSGITRGGTNANYTLTNDGVLNITAGSGITRGGTKTNYTLANDGVTSLIAGTGIVLDPVNGKGDVTVSFDSGDYGVSSINVIGDIYISPDTGVGEVSITAPVLTEGSNIQIDKFTESVTTIGLTPNVSVTGAITAGFGINNIGVNSIACKPTSTANPTVDLRMNGVIFCKAIQNQSPYAGNVVLSAGTFNLYVPAIAGSSVPRLLLTQVSIPVGQLYYTYNGLVGANYSFTIASTDSTDPSVVSYLVCLD